MKTKAVDKKIDISTFTYKDQDFDLLVNKNKLSYIFEVKGNRYGNAVEVKGRKKLDVANAAMNLLLNFVSTYEAVKAKGK